MLTLIKREIQDHIAFFIAAAAFSAVFIVFSLSIIDQYYYRPSSAFSTGLVVPAVIFAMLGICAMGAAQMYTDRTRKISAFVSTLPISRSRILLARIITGILAILTFLIPLAITADILLSIFTPPIPMYSGIVFEIFIATFLTAFACYCIGLQTGWDSSKTTPTLAGLGLTCILVSLIIVKGFGLHIVVILVLFIIASLTRTWHKFMSTPL